MKHPNKHLLEGDNHANLTHPETSVLYGSRTQADPVDNLRDNSLYHEKFAGYYLLVTSTVTKFTSNLLVNLVTSNKFRLLVTLLVTVTSKLLVTSI